MTRKDRGVVLKTGRSGETSKMVTFLGRASGKVKLLGKGALASKSPFRGALEAGNGIEVVFYYKEGRTLYFIKEVHVLATLGAGAATLDNLASNLAALELLDRICFWGSPEERIVDLTESYLACHAPEDPLAAYLAFELRLLDVLGALPQLRDCSECGAPTSGGFYYPADGNSRCRKHAVAAPQRVRIDNALVNLASFMSTGTFEEVGRAHVEAVVRKRLGKLLHWTYTFHVQGYSLPESLKLIPRRRH
jgi:DNA repair protein RecO